MLSLDSILLTQLFISLTRFEIEISRHLLAFPFILSYDESSIIAKSHNNVSVECFGEFISSDSLPFRPPAKRKKLICLIFLLSTINRCCNHVEVTDKTSFLSRKRLHSSVVILNLHCSSFCLLTGKLTNDVLVEKELLLKPQADSVNSNFFIVSKLEFQTL